MNNSQRICLPVVITGFGALGLYRILNHQITIPTAGPWIPWYLSIASLVAGLALLSQWRSDSWKSLFRIAVTLWFTGIPFAGGVFGVLHDGTFKPIAIDFAFAVLGLSMAIFQISRLLKQKSIDKH